MKTSFFLLALALPYAAMAQETKEPTVVKSGAVEMKAVDERPAGVIILSPAMAKGDFDVAPSHPSCEKMKGQEQLDCTAAEVKKVIRSKMKEPALDIKQWGTSAVSIFFTINQYGEVKDVRVDHSGDAELSKHVMVALYDLPRFVPARKAETNVTSSMQVNYRYEELFP
jgi:hypothetical protein